MKILVVEGDPAARISGPFLRTDISDCDAVLIIRDKWDLSMIAGLLKSHATGRPPYDHVKEVDDV